MNFISSKMSVPCEVGINHKVAGFSTFLNANENGQTLTNENLELLSKFAEYLKTEKMDKLKHRHEFKHGFGKFGKHGHHGMFGHHFGRHGPFGRHGYGHALGRGYHRHGYGGHRHGHHGKHGGGRHEFDFGKFGSEFHGKHKHCHGPEFSEEHDKHHTMGKHFWKWAMFHEACKNRSGECMFASGHNPSLREQETASSTADNTAQSQTNSKNCGCYFKPRHGGKHGRFVMMCPCNQDSEKTTAAQSEEIFHTDANSGPQENLATMVENITIQNSPTPQE